MSLTLACVLIIAGLLLLLAELLVPSGICFVIAVCAIVAGVIVAFLENVYAGWLTLGGVVILLPAVLSILFRYGPKTPMGRRFFLRGYDDDATVASMPVNLELEQLRGRFGRTLSDLRPAGVTDFDGKRIDTITEGVMVEAGRWVRCIEVKAGKVIVRPVDRPHAGPLETGFFS